jgi:hypothetical protein
MKTQTTTGSRFAALRRTASTEPAIAPRRGRPPGKKSSPDYRPLTVYVPKDLHERMKDALYRDRREFSQFVADAFAAHLAHADHSATPKSRKGR